MAATPLVESYSQRIQWEQLDLNTIRRLIEKARAEDLSGFGLRLQPAHLGDVTSQLIQPHVQGNAKLVARSEMIIAGIHLVPIILESYRVGVKFYPEVNDGDLVEINSVIGSFSGSASGLLQAERIVLNFIQKLSGIATLTHQFVKALGNSNTRLLDTRKTTPGMRALEKYAVACGGGWNHRFGLFDRIMIKDNHLAAAKAQQGDPLTAFVDTARKRFPDLVIEVEVDSLDQIEPVIAGGAHIILLDNFSNEETKQAVELVAGRAATEASGGINLDTITQFGSLGLDFISTGATIHQSKWMDIGLDWES